MPVNNTNNLISWEFPEFTKQDRGKTWYISVFGISILFIIFAIVTQNWLFALIIIMIDAILISQQNKEPSEINFTITKKSIQIDGKNISFKEIDNFWIVYEPPETKNIYFVFKSKIRPRLSIPLIDTNPLKVRQLLSEYLEEDLDKEDEPTSESLAKMLKI